MVKHCQGIFYDKISFIGLDPRNQAWSKEILPVDKVKSKKYKGFGQAYIK